MQKADEIQLVDLQLDSQRAFERLYTRHRGEFLAFGKRYLTSEEDITDIYQDAIIALFERVKDGKLNALSCSVKTYLFSIGKFLMIDRHKEQIKMRTQTEDTLGLIPVEMEPAAALNPAAEPLAQALSAMDEICRRIVTLYYYRGFDLESIADTMKYKNANVVKSHKARCMQRLRTIYQKMI